MDMDGYGLVVAVAPLLRAEREKAALTQGQLARRAATTQQHLSMIESGGVAPTTALLDRLFDAMGLQLRLTVEQRDADLDAGIDAARDDPLSHHVWACDLLTKRLPPDVPYLIDGQLAAAAMGVPLKVARTDLAFAESDVEHVARWLAEVPNALRWSEDWQDFAPVDRDPRAPGPLDYWTPWSELHLRLLAALPAPVLVTVGDRQYPIRPLPDVEADYPQIARIMRRARQRATLS